MQCIVCAETMTGDDRIMRCACGGAWATDVAITQLAAAKGAMSALQWRDREGDHRPCPACAAPMRNVWLDDVELDRCDAHGVWFDVGELEDAISELEAHRRPASLGGAGWGTPQPSTPMPSFSPPAYLDTPASSGADIAIPVLGFLADLLGAIISDS